jgi:hypothetical protein
VWGRGVGRLDRVGCWKLPEGSDNLGPELDAAHFMVGCTVRENVVSLILITLTFTDAQDVPRTNSSQYDESILTLSFPFSDQTSLATNPVFLH